MSYSDKLRDPRWQKKRLKIMERDNFKCVLCKDEHTTLNVHHEKYIGNPWDIEDEFLKTLCENCHSITHDAKRNIIKVFKKLSNTENTSYFFVYTNESVLIYNRFEGSPIQLIITIFYGTLQILIENKPEL